MVAFMYDQFQYSPYCMESGWPLYSRDGCRLWPSHLHSVERWESPEMREEVAKSLFKYSTYLVLGQIIFLCLIITWSVGLAVLPASMYWCWPVCIPHKVGYLSLPCVVPITKVSTSQVPAVLPAVAVTLTCGKRNNFGYLRVATTIPHLLWGLT